MKEFNQAYLKSNIISLLLELKYSFWLVMIIKKIIWNASENEFKTLSKLKRVL